MNIKKWIFTSGIVVVALMAVMLLVPMAFAQGPVDGPTGPQLDTPAVNGQMAGQGGRMGMTGFAAGPMGQRGQGTGPGFVDENGDGVCDNFVDADGDGVCDNAGTGQGGRGGRMGGQGFVDDNGDGVCDHAGQGGQMRGGGQGQMMGRWGQAQ